MWNLLVRDVCVTTWADAINRNLMKTETLIDTIGTQLLFGLVVFQILQEHNFLLEMVLLLVLFLNLMALIQLTIRNPNEFNMTGARKYSMLLLAPIIP